MNDKLEHARLTSAPVELADKVRGYIQAATPDSGNSHEVAEWQRRVNDAHKLRKIVGQFVAGMGEEELLIYLDSAISAQSWFELPSTTELMLVRESVAKLLRNAEEMKDLIANACDNLGDMPVSDEWSEKWVKRAESYLAV